jgi:hypothetical protein
MVTEGMMEMLDLFERGDVDPAARAKFIIEHFDRDIVIGRSPTTSMRPVEAHHEGHRSPREGGQGVKTGRRVDRTDPNASQRACLDRDTTMDTPANLS